MLTQKSGARRRTPISLVVLTYNEERNLPACLESVSEWVGEAFIVDSGSTDRTADIALQYGAQVFVHAFEGHTQQWDWALQHLPLSFDWVLCLDADHRVTPALQAEIESLFVASHTGVEPSKALGGLSLDKVAGLYIKRRQIFRRRWIKYGGYYPKYLLKLFRRDAVTLDTTELVDHHFYVRGQTANLRHDLLEDNLNEYDIVSWSSKHLHYAVRQAQEEYQRHLEHRASALRPALFGTPDQRTLWLKRCWYQLPLYVRPVLYFAYRYLFRLGFLDGKQGFIFHFLQGFWYRLLVDIVLDDLRQAHQGTSPYQAHDVKRSVESESAPS